MKQYVMEETLEYHLEIKKSGYSKAFIPSATTAITFFTWILYIKTNRT